MKRFFGWLFIIVSLTLLVGPFMVPVPEIRNTVEPVQLADEESLFIAVDGLSVHYKQSGDSEPSILLLHGLAASTFTWREVMNDFSSLGRTVAYDRTAFGLTERPVEWEGRNPYAVQAQVSQATGLMDALDIERAVLVGHSVGGRTAVSIALARPERVRALVLVSPATGTGRGNLDWLRPLMLTPQMDHLGPWLARRIETYGNEVIARAWHDPSRLTDAVFEGYRKPLRAHDWDRALWEFSRAPRTEAHGKAPLEDRLGELAGIPTLVTTGDDDRIVPVSESRSVAEKIPGSRFVELADCGHLAQEECPEAFFREVTEFLEENDLLGAPSEPPESLTTPISPVEAG